MHALHSHPDRRDPRRLAMFASLSVAVLMLFGKLGAWYITGSTAILSDALESVIHLFATGIAAFGLWYAAQPPDAEHPYGHGKIAYFVTAIEGFLIFVAAIAIITTAINALIVGPELQQLGIGLLITAVLAGINAVLGFSLVYVGRKHNAIVLVANGHHVLTDMWTSIGVVAGVALVWITGILWLDPVIAILVGLNIIWTASKLMKDAYHGLMERADGMATELLQSTLNQFKEDNIILDWHQLRHRRVNDHVWVEVHLLFPGRLSITEAHHKATTVEETLRSLFPADSVSITSHLEPESHEHPDGVHDEVGDALNPEIN